MGKHSNKDTEIEIIAAQDGSREFGESSLTAI